MNPLRAAFSAGHKLLMPFLVAAYPSQEDFPDVVDACVEEGADVLEVGLPFSDPIMDGPVIAAASHEVLERGAHFTDHVEMLARAAAARRPVVAMTYYNLLLHRGLHEVARMLAGAGACGAIVPDLPVDAAGPWREACEDTGLACVFLAAQTSTSDRLRAIGEASTGFVYAASLLGVTGTREELDAGARALVSRIREVTDVPVALGIGVSTAQQAADASTFADGVIVGSALIARLRSADPAAAARSFVADLRAGIDAANA